jgi:hypothetical protein
MKNNIDKKVGIWLDHTKAHFIYLSKEPAVLETTFSNRESQVRVPGETSTGMPVGKNRYTNNEHHQHNREQKHMNEYYAMLSDRLKSYDDIFIFGSTTAKEELYNRLKADKHFGDKTINVRPADHLTENQMVAEVKKFFNL